jgi:hypothetical protein
MEKSGQTRASRILAMDDLKVVIHHPCKYLFTYSQEVSPEKSYHSDMKYHMTLDNIYSVVHSKIFRVIFKVSSFPRPLTTSNFYRKINSCLDT